MDLSIGLGIENSNIECLYLRASCYHAIGEYGEAVLMSFLFLIFHGWLKILFNYFITFFLHFLK